MSSSDNNTKYYEILGVSKENFSQEDLKKAYKKSVCKNHPSIGGNPDEVMESYRAYQILCDPEKRQLYDQYGEDAVKDLVDGVPFYDIYDLPVVTPTRGEDLVYYSLKVSFQDLLDKKQRSFHSSEMSFAPSAMEKEPSLLPQSNVLDVKVVV